MIHASALKYILFLFSEQVIVTGDRRISGSLEPGETITFSISVPTEGTNFTLSTTQGTVSNFYSTTITTPSEIAHDFRSVTFTPLMKTFITCYFLPSQFHASTVDMKT